MPNSVGVYDISGAVMVSPGTKKALSSLPRSLEIKEYISASAHVKRGEGVGSIIREVPLYSNNITSSMHEVTRLNAFLSCSERFESGSNIEFFYSASDSDPQALRQGKNGIQDVTVTTGSTTFKYYSWAEGDNFYSKESRLNYFSYRYTPTMVDVLNNPPENVPSGSSGSYKIVKDTHGANGTGCRISMSYLGTVSNNGVQGFEIVNWSGSTALGGITIGNLEPYLGKALSGNLVYNDDGERAVVTASSFAGDTIGFYLGHDEDDNFIQTTGFSMTNGTKMYLLSWIPLSSSMSGVFFNNSSYAPTNVRIPVNNQGKIRDLRTWVEFIHDYRDTNSTNTGLQSVALALRSPNTNFNSCHPLWNDPTVGSLPINSDFYAVSAGEKWSGIPELFRNSYLLWTGKKTEAAVSSSFPGNAPLVPKNYREFDYDLDMRTVFWDGSPVNNPRDISCLFPSASLTTTGSRIWPSGNLTSSLKEFYQSPTLGFYQFYTGTAGLGVVPSWLTPSLTGAYIPWFYDYNLPKVAGLTSVSAPVLAASKLAAKYDLTSPVHPIDGWNEPDPFNPFPQFGPSRIRPCYPTLDDVYAIKMWDDPVPNTPFTFGYNRKKIQGMRPGLRGTQMTGSWSVLIGTAHATPFVNSLAAYKVDPVLEPNLQAWYKDYGYVASTSSGIWLRQLKLEFISDISSSNSSFIPSSARRFSRSFNVKKNGFTLLSVSSGTCNWDLGLDFTLTYQSPDFGRTVSITDDKNAPPDSYAVLSYLSGPLSSSLAEVGITRPEWYLGTNGFGTPYIPDTSMSLGTGSAEEIDTLAAGEILKIAAGITPAIPGSNDTWAYLARQGYAQTAQRLAELSASVKPTSSYFIP